MPRPARRDTVYSGNVYHVIVRGNNKQPVFLDEQDYHFYSRLLFEEKKKFQVSVYHYVLMPNHVHLMVRPEGDLSAFMHGVQLAFAKYFRKKYGHAGHVWQDRFKSIGIETDSYMLACGNYIEMNPVRAGLAAKPEDWRHTSYRIYAFGAPDALTDIDPSFTGLAATPELRRKRYRELVVMTRSV